MIFCTICIIVLFAGCNNAEKQVSSPEFSFDSKGHYNGFKNLPSDYTLEMAKKDGYYVKQDSEVIANESVWENFILASSQEKNGSIRMVSFYTEDKNSPYFVDLFYKDGYYYLFDSSAENSEKKPFKYLLKLKGQFGNLSRDSSVILLTDDNSLTFDMVITSMISSNLEFIKSVPEYKLIMFL